MITFIKRIVAFWVSLATVLAGFLGIDNSLTDKRVDDFRVTTYIRGDALVYWGGQVNAEDFDIVTDAIIFECASFNNKGEIQYDEEKMDTVLSMVRTAIGDRDVHLTLNLLGPGSITDSDVWEDQMESQSDEHNKAFTSGVLEDNIIALLDKYDFDGVHFDYEYPLSLKAWHYYNKFLVSLDKKLGDYTLGVAGNAWNIKFTNAAVDAIDTFELMSYDMLDEQGRHATYEDTVEMAQQMGLRGVPPEKVNIGLAFYSRPTDLSPYWYGYNGCIDGIDENGWYHCEETGKDFWFNTPDVVQAKTDYAIRNGFGGVMIWHYNCDLPSSDEASLLRAVGRAVESNY